MGKQQDRPKINPQLLEALDSFASTRCDLENPAFVVTRSEDGKQQHWSVERACAVAHHILSTEELHFLKFKALVEGLERLGLEGAYERIMGQKIDEAMAR